MNAKQAREYAHKLLTKVEGINKVVFDEVLQQIKDTIDANPTHTYLIVEYYLPKQVIAWLESKEYGYETASCQTGINEEGTKISWSEDGLKMNYYDK